VPGVGLRLARQQRHGQGARDADALGTGSASLYAHMASRDELMVDRIAAGVTVPEPDPARWQDQLRAYAQHAQHAQQVWASHADIARASLATIPAGPERLRVIEGLLAILRAAGFSDRVAAWAVDRLQIYIDADVFEGDLNPQPREISPERGNSYLKDTESGRRVQAIRSASRMANLIASHPDIARRTAAGISAGRFHHLGGGAGRGSRRSGWPAGTSTRTIRMPSGSVIHISVRPQGSVTGSRITGTPAAARRACSARTSRTWIQIITGPPAGPSACPETSRNPCPRKKTIPGSAGGPNSR
jgi:hypothetical protein